MPKAKPTMTIKAALAMLTGPRSISNPDLECLGEGDLLALQTLLADHADKSKRLAAIADYAGRRVADGILLDAREVARLAK